MSDMEMTIKINPTHLAAARFRVADDAWANELRHVFGREACQARYEKRGRGYPGSTLAALHDTREKARQHWETITGLRHETYNTQPPA